jgi:hypothetical protein
MVIQSVWHIAERGEWTMESKGDSAEELHSVERGKQICEVLCSRPGVKAMSPEY